MGMHSGPRNRSRIRLPWQSNPPHHELQMWYTVFALNTSVVLCGPSGAVLDLRFPASSFLRTFYA
jgi:hypothetical protein